VHRQENEDVVESILREAPADFELVKALPAWPHRGTQFTCFTGTKVQILTLKVLHQRQALRAPRRTLRRLSSGQRTTRTQQTASLSRDSSASSAEHSLISISKVLCALGRKKGKV
jgi:hypothetical protein